MPNEPVVAAPVAAVTPSPASPVAAPVAAPAAAVVPPVVDAAKQAADAAALRTTVEKELRGTVETEQLAKFTAAAKKQGEDWANAAKTDAEIGGVNFDSNLVSAKNVLNTYATPEFKSFLETTGLGNHPSMIKLLVKVAKAVGEDKLLAGGQGSGQAQAKSAAEVLYGGTMKPK